MTLADTLLAVAARVSYLRAGTSCDGPDWIRGDELLGDPAVLATVIQGTKPGFGTDDDTVAASLFTEAYAFRVAGTALAAFALDLPVPDVTPASVAVRIDKPRPSAVAYLNPGTSEPDAAALSAGLIDAHLRPLVDSVHAQFRVGERNLWGNVADACAVAFRAVESSGAERRDVRARAERFFTACAPTLAELGEFTVVEHDGREGWYWDRTSCCLWFRTTDGQMCDNCSLIDRAELHARRVRELDPIADA